MHKSSLIITSIIIVCFALSFCSPIPVETEPHQVSVKAIQEPAGKYMDSARFRAVSDDVFIRAVLDEITKNNNKAGIVPGHEFMAAIFPGKHSATIEELASDDVIERIRELSVTHIILIEHRSTGDTIHGKVTAAATLVNTEQLYQVETLSFDAEGHRVGISLPLPYVFLFFPYSDPDVFGSATRKMAEVISDKYLKDSRGPLTLTILTSDNLAELISNTHEQQTELVTSPSSTNVIKRWKNPFSFYSDLMSDAREEGGWIYFNPLAHAQVLFYGVIMSPTMVAVDTMMAVEAMLDKDESTSSPHNLTPLNTEVSQEGGRSIDAEWKLHKDARTYCQRADLGHADAQTYIGDIYYLGAYGLDKNLMQAYVWYNLAADNGNSYAARQSEKVVTGLSPQQLNKAQIQLEEWEPGHCKNDLLEAISQENE